MKANYMKLFLLLLCGLLISDSIPVQAKEKSWKLVFYDDFNSIGKERFDTTKWIVPDREPYKWSRWISDSKSVVLRRNGKLICRAIPNTAFADSAKMLTGAICTKGKFSFKYGKLEVKMKTNFLPGNFPAVWLLPENQGNPYRYGEFGMAMSSLSIRAISPPLHNSMSSLRARARPLFLANNVNFSSIIVRHLFTISLSSCVSRPFSTKTILSGFLSWSVQMLLIDSSKYLGFSLV